MAVAGVHANCTAITAWCSSTPHFFNKSDSHRSLTDCQCTCTLGLGQTHVLVVSFLVCGVAFEDRGVYGSPMFLLCMPYAPGSAIKRAVSHALVVSLPLLLWCCF